MQISKITQKEVDSITKLHSYLEYKTSNCDILYHYTNLTNLIKIIKSGRLFLNNIKHVNDAMEAALAQHANMYVASFTYEKKEAVHYWSVYGKNNPYSLRISFNRQSIYPVEPFRTLDGNLLDVKDCKLSDVIYYNNDISSKKRGYWKHNGNYFSLYNDEATIRREFPGLCKYDVWEHEKEIRLLVISDINEDGIYLDLHPDFYISMDVVFSPWIEEEIRVELSEMLISLIKKKYNIEKNISSMSQSTIHNQIRIR